MIFLDNAATTLKKPKSVAKAAMRAIGRCASPGRGGYEAAERAAERVYDCRVLAGELFDTEPEQVVFTMNATHGLNIAVKSLVFPGDRVVVSGFEHNAVMRPLVAVGADVVTAGRRLFDPEGAVEEFARTITPGTRAVICTHVSNVFGYILPVEAIGALCRERGVPFVLDASQSAGCLPVSLKNLGAAFIAMPGHKGLYGPQGTGLLLCGEPGQTVLEGGTGSQSALFTMPSYLPDRQEAGTHNVCGICGLAKGLEFVLKKTPEAIGRKEQGLIRLAAEKLEKQAGVQCFSGPPACQAGVLSFRLEGLDSETAAARLAGRGIAVRAGLHCAPLAHQTAGTLETGTVRISAGAWTSKRDILALVRAVEGIRP